MVAWLRSHPEALFTQQQGSTLSIARENLEKSLSAYKQETTRQPTSLRSPPISKASNWLRAISTISITHCACRSRAV